MSIKSTSLIVFVMWAISAVAQPQMHAHAAAAQGKKVRAATQDCQVTFNNALPSFCVTANGNIENFEFPAGSSQIFSEGYGVCDETGGTSYYDVGDADSNNWQAALITAGGGNNKLPLTIKRTSSDGIWTITQTFSRNTADAYVKVQITLKNNTAVDRTAYMTRYVDIDADMDASHNYFDGTANSGWGYLSAGTAFPNHGLTIRSAQSVHNYFGFNTLSSNVDPCTFAQNPTDAPTLGDEAVMYTWVPNGTFIVGKGKSIKVTLEYRPM
jgi:hypothetical protein